MKQIHLLFILLLFGACAGKTQDHFVLRGHVPGAEDSTKVDMWSEDRSIRLSGYVVNETFELTGKAPMPMYCHLSMNNSDVARSKGLQGEDDIRYVEANFFIENGNLDFTVPHIDSLPQSFWLYDIRKENNYTVEGSASHDVFDRYRRKT
ncbi:MAG: DUF4369 domain-containing protein, partial [Odoribacter sp.]|nr:DUF4369 domain-containing protein [Odoribacter sp.]